MLLARTLNGYGLGDYSMDTPCTAIPAGDPYRTTGNYCTQPSGNVMEFNADGSIDPDPFAPSANATPTASANSGGASIWGDVGTAAASLVKGLISPGKPTAPTAPTHPMVMPTPWYKTPWGIIGIIALVGGGAYFLAKR